MTRADASQGETNDAVDRVVARLRSRVAILGELEAVTRRRSAAIAEGRIDAIARLGEAREKIVERLLSTSLELEDAARQAAGAASPEAMRLIEEATLLLSGIEEADRRDEATLRESGGRARRGLDQLASTGRATRAYRGGSGVGPTRHAASPGSRTEQTG